MNKKNILIITAAFPPEPIVAANLMANLAEELSKKYLVTVLRPIPTRPFGFNMPDLKDKNLPYDVITLNSFTSPESSLIGRFKESISFGKAASNYIKLNHNKIDFIYNAAWPLFGKNIIAKTSKEFKIPYFTVVQDIYPESLLSKLPNIPGTKKILNTILLPLDKYILQNAIKVHAISEPMKEYLISTRKLKDENVMVIRNWQDERNFPITINKRNISSDYFTFMYLGNIGPLAGIETLIDGVEILNKTNSNFKLIIAGSGSSKESLKQEVNKRNISNIEFLEVPHGKVAEIQSKADVMMLPIKKGFGKTSVPSKLPAYMFSAKPIISSVDSDSDTAFCINSSKSGWIVSPENEREIADAMEKAMEIPKQDLYDMGNNGREFALKNLSRKNNLTKITSEIDKFFKE